MRELFDIPDDVAYLNCAYMAPQLKAVTRAGAEALQRKARPWQFDIKIAFKEIEYLRSLVAKLIGADNDGIAIIPSVSYGIQVAATNITVSSGSEIVVLEEQFPSNVYPWRSLAFQKGAIVRTVSRPDSGDWKSRILSAISERTAIVAVPNCHWSDGSAVDLVAVGKGARDVGAALVVDASQSLGAWELDLCAIKPDFLVSVGYKWLLGPLGLSYLYVAPHYRSGEPIEYSWLNRSHSEDFTQLAKYRDEYQIGARRFDMGERNNLLCVPMAIAALEQILEWGTSFISAEIAKKTWFIEQGANRLGLLPVSAAFRAPHMLGVRLPSGNVGNLAQELQHQKVYVSLRGDSIRISPHLYNNDSDLNRLFDALGSIRSR